MKSKEKKYTGTLQEQLEQYKYDRVKTDPDFAREVEAARFPPPAGGGE